MIPADAFSVLPIIATAGAISLIVTYVLIIVAPRLGLVDTPNARSMHHRTTPRGGGISIVGVTLGGFLGCVIVPDILSSSVVLTGPMAYVLTSGIVALVSLRDDFRSMSSLVRMSVHTSAGIVLVALIAFGPDYHYTNVATPGKWFILFTLVLGLTAATNFYNFMDGIDGIAATQGVVACSTWLVISLGVAASDAAILAALLVGSCIGFGALNWNPARIFMGDVGSAFLGFSVGAFPLLVRIESTVPTSYWHFWLLDIFILWPFLADCTITLVSRIIRREPFWKAHKSHIYQRLVSTGWSHRRVTLLYGSVALVCALAALGFHYGMSLIAACTICTFTTLVLIGTLIFRQSATRSPQPGSISP